MKRRMTGRCCFRLFLFTVLMMGLAFEARAAVFTVDRTDDPDPTTAMGCDAATPNDCSLRGAIVKANGAADADEIKLPASATPYTLSIAIDGTPDDGADGDLDIIHDLTITGDGADVTTIDGNGIDRVFHILASGAPKVTIQGVTITKGKTPDAVIGVGPGGGVCIDGGTVTLEGIAVDDNATGSALFGLAAPGGNGGGIAVLGGTVTLRHSAVSNNHTGDGGSNMSLASGEGGLGGGVWVSGGTVTVSNSTVSGNKTGNSGGSGGSGGFGGGLFLGGGTVTLNNITVAENQTGTASGGSSGGGSGGGLAVGGGTINLHNSLLAKNIVGSGGAAPDCNGTVNSSGFNLIGDGTGCTGPADGTNGDSVGTGATPIDPKLGLLQNNGGPTKTYALLAGSPALDTADNASCETDDQRGDPRPIDGNGDGTATCDKGAFELNQCGDGVVQQGEQCDDGNTTSGDGCSSTCQTESSGGGSGGGGCSLGISSNGVGETSLRFGLPFILFAVTVMALRRRRS